MLLISAKVDGEFKQRLIAQCERNIIKLRRHSRSDYSRGPEGVISIIPVQSGGTVVTGAVHRTRFVLLSLFRFLLLSVSQLVKTAAALGARLMTRRVETKDSFAKRQVYVADKLDETALSSHPSFFVRFPLSTRVYASSEETNHHLLLLLPLLPRTMHLLSRNCDAIPSNWLMFCS